MVCGFCKAKMVPINGERAPTVEVERGWLKSDHRSQCNAILGVLPNAQRS
jgi:hypothetical protein